MLRFFYNLARILFLVWIIRTLYHWFMDGFSQARPRNAPSPAPLRVGETRRDPVCGMFVSTELSVRAQVKGHEEHFCSPTCRDKYLAA